MPLGDYFGCLFKSPASRLLYTVFGTEDLHSHYRLRPMIEFFSRELNPRNGSPPRILEVGSGSGQNLFELAKLGPIDAVGYDLSPVAVEHANSVSKSRFGGRIHFNEADAAAISESNVFDYILFMDILEHVRDPQLVIERLEHCLKPGGAMIVSVPTPRYPRVFGREMHERIGHLVEGYRVQELARLFPGNFTMEQFRYSTGLVAGSLCAIQVRALFAVTRSSRLGRLLSLPLLALQRFDPINGESVSCSLFAVMRKSRTAGTVAA